MSRNKNRKNDEPRHVFPAPLAGILAVAVTLSLGYLWLCGRCDAMGRDIKKLEQRKVELQRKIENEEYKWSNMTSPQNMASLLKAHNLEMTWPGEGSIIRMQRSGRDMESDAQVRQFAQNELIYAHD